MNTIRPFLANLNPELPKNVHNQLVRDFQRFADEGLPVPLESYIHDCYRLDVASTYAGIPIKNPWGKASGQLSMTPQQVEEDAAAGLGFCVLKTVIARGTGGEQSMKAWAIPESRMVLERITGANGRTGWTVSWQGRGWYRSFEDYLELVQHARRIGDAAGMLTVPSCKYYLPTAERPEWETDEYNFTTQSLLSAYRSGDCQPNRPMPLEKDFSPTLAGSAMATEQRQILDWLRRVPSLVRGAVESSSIRLGLKLFNALFDDEFQIDMLKTVASATAPDRPNFVVYANRLFDPGREFEGRRGIAVGGPDLSARNLRALEAFRRWRASQPPATPIEMSGTGDICSGRIAVEYLLLGCSSFQLHTFFQLPTTEYPMRRGNKTLRALHRLYFDPHDGFIAWALHAAHRLGFDQTRPVRILELVDRGTDEVFG